MAAGEASLGLFNSIAFFSEAAFFLLFLAGSFVGSSFSSLFPKWKSSTNKIKSEDKKKIKQTTYFLQYHKSRTLKQFLTQQVETLLNLSQIQQTLCHRWHKQSLLFQFPWRDPKQPSLSDHPIPCQWSNRWFLKKTKLVQRENEGIENLLSMRETDFCSEPLTALSAVGISYKKE